MSKELKNSEASLITNEQVAKAAMELLASGKTLDRVEMSRGLRARVREFLARAAGFKDSDVSAIAERTDLAEQLRLAGHYDERADQMIDLISRGIFAEGAPMPTREKVLDSFSARDLKVASAFQEPTLLLVPETSFRGKVAALNATKTIKGQKNVNVDEIYSDHDDVPDNIKGWRASIVDGAITMEVKDGMNVRRVNVEKRIRKRIASRNSGEKGFSRHIYAILMLKTLGEGKPIDQETFTLLDDEPCFLNSSMLSANWDTFYNRVEFGLYNPRNVGLRARLRSSVGGNVLL